MAAMLPNVGLLILRIGLGSVMFAHGAQKLLGWYGGPGIQGFVGWMASMGVPAWLAWLAILAEFVGGLAVILGLFARLGALAFAANMVVAIGLVHWQVGFFNTQAGAGWEYPWALLTASLALALLGPGPLAIADLEPRWFGKRPAGAAPLPRETPART
jgi:putative oxidoreductase